MRLFGILLIVANLLAGAGFVYLASQDWKGRQAINAAGLRHLLVLQGLPLEGPDLLPDPDGETPFVVELGGGESTKTISKKLLESYFRDNAASAPAATTAPDGAAGGAANVLTKDSTPVTNQISELKRAQGLIKGELARADLSAAAKLALLKGWLLYQAENFDTRAAYLALIARGDVAKLEEVLDARFAAALAKPQTADGPASGPDGAAMTDKDKVEKSAAWRSTAVLDETERRMRVAHLLVHLDTDPAWQKRVALVVGLRRYVKAIAAQVLRFKDMIDHVELGIPGDQATYAREESMLREMTTQRADRAAAVRAERNKLREQKDATNDAVSRRKTQLKELTDQLAKIKAEVDDMLVQQSAIEKQLFEIQREVGLTLEEVYRLEELLDAVERERFGLPPRPRP